MYSDFGYVRVAAAVPSTHVADVAANVRNMLELAGKAAAERADFLVFPELCITGYTCADLFHQDTLLDAAERGLLEFCRETAGGSCVYVVGAPVACGGLLFNCGVVVQSGRILGAVPKTFLPQHNEYYEARWFAPADAAPTDHVRIGGVDVPFGADLLFCTPDGRVTVGLEVCEDLWAPVPPSSRLAVDGALLLLNLSASNEQVAKADYRRELVRQQSARCLAGYVYASCGFGESTTDLVFSGHTMIAENGVLLAEGERFQVEPQLIVADIDLEFLRHERAHNITFGQAVRHAVADASRGGRAGGRCGPRTVEMGELPAASGFPEDLRRRVDPHPFVPADPARRSERCEDIFAIQSTGLATRLRHIGCNDVVIGLSGGLDSTLALLVTVEAFRLLGLDRAGIHAVTMPGFGTTKRTRGNVEALCSGLDIPLLVVDIREACRRHLEQIGHDARTPDLTYENAQARERTQVLMDLANKVHGIVVGTGDLSELALGWCTYNGDHMSMYGVNGGVPKTLVRYLIEYVADLPAFAGVAVVLRDILATPISPELLPPDENGEIAQKTEDTLGPYEIHDFFLYHFVRRGHPPEKLFHLARVAFGARYSPEMLRETLERFLRRFFAQQFKRSCLPDGPKVGSVALSPRGDWRMPSDARVDEWLRRLPPASQ